MSSDKGFVAAVRAVIPGCLAVAPAECSLLGADVGNTAVSARLTKGTEGLRAVANRFADIDRLDALAPLHVSLGHPRAVYELRAGASFRDPTALAAYGLCLRDVEGASLFFGLPSFREGTRLSDVELSVIVGLRLGLPVAVAGTFKCGERLEALGDQALSCNRGVEHLRRHDEVNVRVRELLGEAGFTAVLSRRDCRLTTTGVSRRRHCRCV